MKDRTEVLQHAEWKANTLLPASNEASTTSALPAADETAVSDGLRLAHYCALEEVVGLAFGAMTVAYIVTSLASLN
jgi:hypothetical protein